MLAAAVLAAVLAPAVALAVTDAERVAVYRDFRAAFDARRYPDALPLAEKLVALTQEQYGANDRELVNPLANLGTTQYRDRKSTRLNSSHGYISYAVFCLKKKNKKNYSMSSLSNQVNRQALYVHYGHYFHCDDLLAVIDTFSTTDSRYGNSNA